ncbi:four-helix bundle copper-binding protein [Paenibacillus xerothermodurans]|uniref:Uncharacterized protein n=1 Tax=Paenibacillus xerothermodurans TaxID=1977292 RepID=A0A2W1NA86_PAEXE|nr:hypothetical protein CBW46_003730 [Paenibacillus xerothermodurans]
MDRLARPSFFEMRRECIRLDRECADV